MKSAVSTLPSAVHGVDAERLQRFATSNLVVAPFKRQAPKRAWLASADMNRKQDVLCAGNVLQGSNAAFGTPAPAMLTSLLELIRLRACDLDSLGSDGSAGSTMSFGVSTAFPRSLGLHVHYAKEGFHQTARSESFLAEVKRGRFLRDPRVQAGLVVELGTAVFAKAWSPVGGPAGAYASQEMVAENANTVLDGLVECELAGTRAAAAVWVASSLLGEDPWRSGVLPSTDVQGAIGFLSAVVAAGAPMVAWPPGVEGRTASHQTWAVAFEVFSR